ncbi:VanW family protein [Phytoactinopolyspora mesophila]|uniref:YoaR-like putative peptidoglycan binding domain-containing protein n=1 Tax=Phytoactinopolyspora mesophila TaxID=2650750 RepID=A0A7K3MBJ7_9ACTN|nr:VanW family protein [Phytoactinopolyspora mesophila]NDL59768.1 hypothetical protein [Phytoactinopolyspora mesophila]
MTNSSEDKSSTSTRGVTEGAHDSSEEASSGLSGNAATAGGTDSAADGSAAEPEDVGSSGEAGTADVAGDNAGAESSPDGTADGGTPEGSVAGGAEAAKAGSGSAGSAADDAPTNGKAPDTKAVAADSGTEAPSQATRIAALDISKPAPSTQDAGTPGDADATQELAVPQSAKPPPPAQQPPGTPPAGAPPEEPATAAGSSGRGRKAAIIAGAVVVTIGVLYGVTYLIAGNKLASNATVAGIEVGGLTTTEARERLEAELPAVVDEPIHIHVGDTESMYDIVPSEAGLDIDIPGTLAAVPGGSANPVSLVQALFGGDEVTPRPAVDEDELRGALDAIAEQADTSPVNAAVGFNDGEVVTSDPVIGTELDIDGAVELISAAFFGSDARELPIGELTVPVDKIEPKVDEAELERAVAEFAEPAMSGPVTIVAGDESVDLPTEMIGEVLSLSPNENGTLQPEIDGSALADLASDELAQIGRDGKDATIRIRNGAPEVVPAQVGKGVDTDSLGDVVLLALTEEGTDRRAEVELIETEPELTTQDAEELGVKEVVAEFTTQFPGAQYRDVNIGRAAELINNTFLRPGDEFSMNETVGERTEANGFTSGIIINQGRLEDAMGGGVSQVATTTYHAAALAGLEDVEHWPHSIYFDRYPLGHEATVAWGSKDLRFKNDTPYGVLLETRFSASGGSGQGSITVRIWSTEYYDVELSTSERSNFTSPQTIYDTSSNCSAQGGSQGFTVTAYRQVRTLDGELVKDEANPWTYNPNHRVVCGPDPDDD